MSSRPAYCNLVAMVLGEDSMIVTMYANSPLRLCVGQAEKSKIISTNFGVEGTSICSLVKLTFSNLLRNLTLDIMLMLFGICEYFNIS